MLRIYAVDKDTNKRQKVLFIDWETTFVKLKNGQLSDFKHQYLYLQTKNKGDILMNP